MRRTPQSALSKAIQARDLDGVLQALDDGASAEPRPQAAESPLGLAVRSGDPRIVAALLSAGASRVPRCLGDAPLTIAAQLGRLEIAVQLLDAGAPLDAEDEDRGTAVQAAAHAGHVGLVRLLVERGAALDIGEPPILAAARAGRGEVVEFLAPRASAELLAMARAALADADRKRRRRAARPNAPRKHVESLFAACTSGDLDTIRRLLDAGIDPNLCDPDSGSTPLHAAAATRDGLAVVQLLVARGAALDLQDDRGETPLSVAARLQGTHEIVRALLAAGAAPDLPDDDARTPLMHAAIAGRAKAVAALLDAGAEPDLRDARGITALMYAARDPGWRHDEVAARLRAAGASEQGVAPHPLMDAVKRGDAAEVERLARERADVDAIDPWGDTALHAAIDRGDARVVRLLLDAGADPNLARRGAAQLPLDRAVVDAKSEELVRLLAERGARLGNRYTGTTPSGKPNESLRLLHLLAELGLEVWSAPDVHATEVR